MKNSEASTHNVIAAFSAEPIWAATKTKQNKTKVCQAASAAEKHFTSPVCRSPRSSVGKRHWAPVLHRVTAIRRRRWIWADCMKQSQLDTWHLTYYCRISATCRTVAVVINAPAKHLLCPNTSSQQTLGPLPKSGDGSLFSHWGAWSPLA